MTSENEQRQAFRLASDKWHQLASVGRFGFWWHEEGNSVKLFATSAKNWQYVFDEEGTTDQLSEILEAFDWSVDPEELQLLVQCMRSIDSWLEWCPSDLHRYGEVGVTF